MPNLHVNGAELKGWRLGLNIFVLGFLLYMGYLMVTGEFNAKVEDVYAAFRDPCTDPDATCAPALLPSQVNKRARPTPEPVTNTLHADDIQYRNVTVDNDVEEELPARRRGNDGDR